MCIHPIQEGNKDTAMAIELAATGSLRAKRRGQVPMFGLSVLKSGVHLRARGVCAWLCGEARGAPRQRPRPWMHFATVPAAGPHSCRAESDSQSERTCQPSSIVCDTSQILGFVNLHHSFGLEGDNELI